MSGRSGEVTEERLAESLGLDADVIRDAALSPEELTSTFNKASFYKAGRYIAPLAFAAADACYNSLFPSVTPFVAVAAPVVSALFGFVLFQRLYLGLRAGVMHASTANLVSATLSKLEEYKNRDPGFRQAIEEFAASEARNPDPVEGRPAKPEPPTPA